MASPTQWTWIWVNSGNWWWTGRPGVLQFMGSQRVGHNWATELNWTELKLIHWTNSDWAPILHLPLPGYGGDTDQYAGEGNQSIERQNFKAEWRGRHPGPCGWPGRHPRGKDATYQRGRCWCSQQGTTPRNQDSNKGFHFFLLSIVASGHKFEQTPGDNEGQKSLVRYSP